MTDRPVSDEEEWSTKLQRMGRALRNGFVGRSRQMAVQDFALLSRLFTNAIEDLGCRFG
jgi:hypothetical protein